MPTPLDLAFVFAFTVVATLFETLVFFPRFKRAIAAGEPGARVRGYRRAIVGQWLFAVAAILIWLRSGRAWGDLGLGRPGGVHVVMGAVIVGVMLLLIGQQVRAIRRLTTDKLDGLKPRIADVAFILPHNQRELRWFNALSVTAGVCEELLYRGFLVWALRGHIGLPGAVVASVVLFALGHSYQGRKGATKAAYAAVAMSVFVLVTGSLVPAMIVHALVDLSGGQLGYQVLSRPASSP